MARSGFGMPAPCATARQQRGGEADMVDIVLTMGMIVGLVATTAITLTLLAIAMNWIGH
jgi:hypothetical protein